MYCVYLRALELGEGEVDHPGVLDLVQGVVSLELSVGVVHGMVVVLPCYLGKVISSSPYMQNKVWRRGVG